MIPAIPIAMAMKGADNPQVVDVHISISKTPKDRTYTLKRSDT